MFTPCYIAQLDDGRYFFAECFDDTNMSDDMLEEIREQWKAGQFSNIIRVHLGRPGSMVSLKVKEFRQHRDGGSVTIVTHQGTFVYKLSEDKAKFADIPAKMLPLSCAPCGMR